MKDPDDVDVFASTSSPRRHAIYVSQSSAVTAFIERAAGELQAL